jgi:hypothetical protein
VERGTDKKILFEPYHLFSFSKDGTKHKVSHKWNENKMKLSTMKSLSLALLLVNHILKDTLTVASEAVVTEAAIETDEGHNSKKDGKVERSKDTNQLNDEQDILASSKSDIGKYM